MRICDWSSDVCSSDLYFSQQAVQRLTGKAIAVKRNQYAIGGDQRRNRIKVQGRRRVQINPLVILVEFFEQFAQFVDLVFRLELGLQLRQLGGGGDDRSEERRGGKGCVGTVRYRGWADHK